MHLIKHVCSLKPVHHLWCLAWKWPFSHIFFPPLFIALSLELCHRHKHSITSGAFCLHSNREKTLPLYIKAVLTTLAPLCFTMLAFCCSVKGDEYYSITLLRNRKSLFLCEPGLQNWIKQIQENNANRWCHGAGRGCAQRFGLWNLQKTRCTVEQCHVFGVQRGVQSEQALHCYRRELK